MHKYIRKINTVLAAIALMVMLALPLVIASPSLTSRVSAITCPDGSTLPDERADECPPANNDATTETKREIDTDCDDESGAINKDNCGIISIIVDIIRVLSSLAGIVIVASIIVGGIQYSTAGPDPQKVSAAKARIRNAVIALIFFIFGFALLNYLVPGGVL